MSDEHTMEMNSASSPYGQQLRHLISAGFQAMLTTTAEPFRVMEIVKALANDLEYQYITWDVARGLWTNISQNEETIVNPFHNEDEPFKFCNPNAALDVIPTIGEMQRMPENAIIVFQNFEPYWEEPAVRQRFEHLCQEHLLVCSAYKRPIVFLQHSEFMHRAVKPYIRPVEFSLPDADGLTEVYEFLTSNTRRSLDVDAELRQDVINGLKGLTSVEAEDTLALGMRRCRGVTPEILDVIEEQKAAVIGKSDVLKYVPKADIDGTELLQGYDEYLSFVANKAAAYDPAARDLNIDLPKGVVLVGIPGTGKSLCAMLTAKMLRRPLVMWDVGAMFGSLVGETEARTRDAIRTIEALQGAVVVIDEADKVLAGMTGGQGDSGVSSRVFGQLLSWLQAKKDESFIIVTMNRTDGIPPEFFRTGRFDAVFGVVEPDEATRRLILEAHFTKRGVDTDALEFTEDDWSGIIQATDKMVGSDLEETVKYARAQAFLERGVDGGAVPSFDELHDAANYVRQQIIAEIDKEGVDRIKKFVNDRTRPVYKKKTRKRQARRHVRSRGND